MEYTPSLIPVSSIGRATASKAVGSRFDSVTGSKVLCNIYEVP